MFIKGLLLLLAVISLSTGRLLPEPETRIIGGKNVDIESAPWQVSLRFTGSHSCGGSIYNESIIITAAHCFYNKDNTPRQAKDLTVLAGSADKLSSATIVKVAKIKPHENYIPSSKGYDIGLLKLSKPLDLTTNKIQKIALAEKDPAPGKKGRVTGWGFVKKTKDFFDSPDYLQAVDIELGVCNKETKKLSVADHLEQRHAKEIPVDRW
ncbi:trypsin beta-like [Drosophila serrata]|uniref:trypsin beta-like n=1 Tax=Drosophila serrata TaxID=7274 RepID=UPI000A1D12EF|nr:trypsin beta-like [Drosophila serrata]